MTVAVLELAQARQAAVTAQLLAAPRPSGLQAVVEHLGRLQIDPVNAVAPAEQLVPFSRLGAYDVGELDRLRFESRRLFEYWAFIVPARDYCLHRDTMRRFPRGERARPRYIRQWLRDNAAFRRHVLARLRRDGPLRSRDLEDRAAVPWRSGGWNDGKNVGRMLDTLWFKGEIAIAGRQGRERIYDLAARVLPVEQPRLPPSEVALRILAGQLAARGVARADQFGFAFDGRPPGWQRALKALVRDGVAVPCRIEGVPGEWYAHAPALEGTFADRTTLLSPFDRLVADRERTAALFGFRYRLEMYVPVARREHGYYVLPILHGERLIGRVDPLLDRRARVLRVHAVYAEPGAPADAGEAIANALRELAGWLGATRITVGKGSPRQWRAALDSL